MLLKVHFPRFYIKVLFEDKITSIFFENSERNLNFQSFFLAC